MDLCFEGFSLPNVIGLNIDHAHHLPRSVEMDEVVLTLLDIVFLAALFVGETTGYLEGDRSSCPMLKFLAWK